jgi:RNA polymerase-binding transcription factor DksA
MDLGTQSHLTTLRQALAWRVRDLQAQLHAAAAARDETPVEDGVTDRKDEADEWQRDEVEAHSEARELAELRQCEQALHRLDLGIYGDCCDCHEPIAIQRLLVQPEAERCATCQADHERALQAGDRAGA